MIPVYIVEDDLIQRESFEKAIRNIILFEDYPMYLERATDNPDEIIKHLKDCPNQGGLFFLDIDLQHELNGFDLAVEIRNLKPLSKIIFVTTHGELAHLTFKHKIEAMDYIVKGKREAVVERIRECMNVAQHRSLREKEVDKNHFLVKTKGHTRAIPIDEIMFFQSSNTPHKVILYTGNSRQTFYSTIKEVVGKSDSFFLCHKSYVINLKNVSAIHLGTREVEMVNGQRCPVAVRKMSTLKNLTEKK